MRSRKLTERPWSTRKIVVNALLSRLVFGTVAVVAVLVLWEGWAYDYSSPTSWALLSDPIGSFYSSNSIMASTGRLHPHGRFDAAVEPALEVFTRWDSVFYLFHAAKIRAAPALVPPVEHVSVFLPFFSFLIAVTDLFLVGPIATLLGWFVLSVESLNPDGHTLLLGPVPRLVISGLIVSAVSFSIAAVFMHKLALLLLSDPLSGRPSDDSIAIANLAVRFWCWLNPASVFFTSVYTEATFAAVSFAGMYYWAKGLDEVDRRKESDKKSWAWAWNRSQVLAVAFFTGAAGIRSNGLLFAGFPLEAALTSWVKGRLGKKNGCWSGWIGGVAVAGFQAAIILTPFIMTQWFDYALFCSERIEADMVELPMCHVWCEDPLPLLYSHVEKTVWDLGFLSYYKNKNYIGIFFALPVLLLSISAFVNHFLSGHALEFFTLGLIPSSVPISKQGKTSPFHASRRLNVYITLWVVLTWIGITYAHVHISTRMLLSSMPLTIIYLAHQMHHGSAIARLGIVIWAIGWCSMGTLAHSFFINWT